MVMQIIWVSVSTEHLLTNIPESFLLFTNCPPQCHKSRGQYL